VAIIGNVLMMVNLGPQSVQFNEGVAVPEVEGEKSSARHASQVATSGEIRVKPSEAPLLCLIQNWIPVVKQTGVQSFNSARGGASSVSPWDDTISAWSSPSASMSTPFHCSIPSRMECREARL